MASAKTGTLAKFGLAGVALGTILSVTITTLTATTANLTTANLTTANITTANIQTISGATINARQASGIVRAVTVSGSTITRSGIGAGVGQAACFKAGGVIGYCSDTPTNGTCTCN